MRFDRCASTSKCPCFRPGCGSTRSRSLVRRDHGAVHLRLFRGVEVLDALVDAGRVAGAVTGLSRRGARARRRGAMGSPRSKARSPRRVEREAGTLRQRAASRHPHVGGDGWTCVLAGGGISREIDRELAGAQTRAVFVVLGQNYDARGSPERRGRRARWGRDVGARLRGIVIGGGIAVESAETTTTSSHRRLIRSR